MDIDKLSLMFCQQDKNDFSFAYFQYLFSIQNFVKLLNLPDEFDEYLEEYFKSREELKSYRWMFELKHRRYSVAAKLLSANLEVSPDGFLQKSLLSLAKLCYVAAWEESELDSEQLDSVCKGISSYL